jgi:hypothetical protein
MNVKPIYGYLLCSQNIAWTTVAEFKNISFGGKGTIDRSHNWLPCCYNFKLFDHVRLDAMEAKPKGDLMLHTSSSVIDMLFW